MKIGQKFNTLTLKEYLFYIDNYKKCADFNTLGLYLSIIENDKLSIDEKIKVREYAYLVFKKSFDFLQLKDPATFIGVSTLGQELTKGDEEGLWTNVRNNQQQILSDKKIKHRNFGIYSKHNCGDENCKWNGIMARQNTWLSENHMHFSNDHGSYNAQAKSEKRKIDRKTEKLIISKELEIN